MSSKWNGLRSCDAQQYTSSSDNRFSIRVPWIKKEQKNERQWSGLVLESSLCSASHQQATAFNFNFIILRKMSSSWTTLFLLDLQGHQQHECWSLDSIKAVFKTGGGSIAHSPPNPHISVARYLTTPETTFHDLSCDQCRWGSFTNATRFTLTTKKTRPTASTHRSMTQSSV